MCADKAAAEQPSSKIGRPFKKGQSGNPSGRPKGSRHPAYAVLDAIGEGRAEEIVQSVANAAISGDIRAAEIILKRAWPERKGRPLSVVLPSVRCAQDVPKATAAIVVAVTEGAITPEEGQALSSLIEAHRKAIETNELEARIRALETNVEKQKS
ncbi:MAG: DUF5681 domain-containing protein [Acetobacter malorum]|uniref:DUF5681 domain-containing protein n=1 Tax=Acetobacter malorum TaxID=178901 RepID=UPI0039EC2FFA